MLPAGTRCPASAAASGNSPPARSKPCMTKSSRMLEHRPGAPMSSPGFSAGSQRGSASDRRGAGWPGLPGAVRLMGMAAVVTVNQLLDGHVALDVECLDRIYLNGYVPNLQVGGQVVSFMTQHLGCPIPSPAIMEKIGTAFRRAVSTFAETEHIPVVRFGKADRKIDVMRRHVAAQAATGRSGVAAIRVAQEYQNVVPATARRGRSGRASVSVSQSRPRGTRFFFFLWGARPRRAVR